MKEGPVRLTAWFASARRARPASLMLVPVLMAAGPALAQSTGATLPSPPSTLQGLASLITAIAWPVIVGFLLLRHGRDLGGIVSSLKSFEVFGVRAEVQRAQADAVVDASSRAKDDGPTARDMVRAEQVVGKVRDRELDEIRREAEALALDYGDVRSARPPGDDRKRAMEGVVAKMRVVGLAAFPLRHALAASPTPGDRLMAIACLQMRPDFDMLEWLAERVSQETAFVAYHALLGLLQAAGHDFAPSFRTQLEEATRRAAPRRDGDAEVAALHAQLLARVASLQEVRSGSPQ